MPLLDAFSRPLRDLRISVIDRCNFRCPYCMPAEIFGETYEFLPRQEILTFEEVVRLAGLFVGLGASKLRITGGEPLLRRELETLIRQLARIQGADDLTLTTNGYLLGGKAQVLKDAGLHRLTISLDSLDPDIFKTMNGKGYDVETVLGAISAAEKAGFHPLKINAVVQKDLNDHTLVDLATHFRGTGHIVRFIEYMDVGNRNQWEMDHVVPAEEILQRIGDVYPIEPVPSNYPGEVAARYRYLDGAGEIGVIASVTRPFCGNCTRARLSTEGRLYTCLFASEGVDLKTPLRTGASDDDLLDIIRGVWRTRDDRYSELRDLQGERAGETKVEMYKIGG
jgi:cyclic pyranopterin phosphate synthase